MALECVECMYDAGDVYSMCDAVCNQLHPCARAQRSYCHLSVTAATSANGIQQYKNEANQTQKYHCKQERRKVKRSKRHN